MEQKILLQQLRDELDGQKVVAALFYTFNFDPRFLEEEILPLFLPDVNFTGNVLAKRIRWRKYFTQLPPVTVYCDALVKVQQAPLLPYEIRRISLPEKDGRIPCYHPKISFFLLDKGSLIVLLGSFNLCKAGWCTNLECGSILHFRPGKYMPKQLKADFRRFIEWNGKMFKGGELTEAEEAVLAFLRKRSLEEEPEKIFFHSSAFAGFEDTLQRIRNRWNEGKVFRKAEVLSPYFSGRDRLDVLQRVVADPAIAFLIPWKSAGEISIPRSLFDAFQEKGVIWSDFSNDRSKQFRFSHAKVYRFWGEGQVFTFVGSVNFTNAGWKKREEGGNLETALVYREADTEAKSWLQPIQSDFSTFVYAEELTAEGSNRERYAVPELECSIDWLSRVFVCHLKTPVAGNLVLGGWRGNGVFKNHACNIEVCLSEEELRAFAANPLVCLEQMTGDKTVSFYYYPLHEHFEARPQVDGLKLDLQEVLNLWKYLDGRDKQKVSQAMDELLEGYIFSRLNSEGELQEQQESLVSTINRMATHVNGVIHLAEHLLGNTDRGQLAKQTEQIDYILFTDNIDTLPNYIRLVKEDRNLIPGMKIFILLMLLNDIYNEKKLPSFYKKERGTGRSEDLKVWRRQLSDDRKELLKLAGVNEKLVNWIDKQIRNTL